jgi:uncharacterized protein YcfJ
VRGATFADAQTGAAPAAKLADLQPTDAKTTMNTVRKTAIALAAGLLTCSAWAQITFYEDDGFRGRAFTINKPVRNFNSVGFNDRASSVVVQSGRWEVCENSNFGGSCVVLRPGSYASLGDMGLNDQLSSVRPADARRSQAPEAPEPMREADYAWRRRANERVFDAPVTSVRAVMGAPHERCWIEREQVRGRDEPNVGRAVLGAVLGGVIGHQIGGGTGKDLATAGGAVAGGVLGARSGGNEDTTRDVRRCTTTPSTTPAYWDVSYTFRGQPHQVQMASAPGASITVNRDGEPRQ